MDCAGRAEQRLRFPRLRFNGSTIHIVGVLEYCGAGMSAPTPPLLRNPLLRHSAFLAGHSLPAGLVEIPLIVQAENTFALSQLELALC